uniref:hypothetical protein n=1 Tax=Klebsiella pneumoniae TaxID=573 RepID=UPI0038573981
QLLQLLLTILMSISRGLSKMRDLLIGRRVSRLENATSATQIPNDNRKKNHTQKVVNRLLLTGDCSGGVVVF